MVVRLVWWLQLKPGSSDGVDDGDCDNFDGIAWQRLRGFTKPLTTQWRAESWKFRYVYHTVKRSNPNKVWLVCKYCHTHKTIDAGGAGIFDVSRATPAVSTHLSQQKRGHMQSKEGVKQRQQSSRQLSLQQAFRHLRILFRSLSALLTR